MKLLFDQNLSPRLVHRLADVYPDCAHVHHLGMAEASDSEIWSFAGTGEWTIVSKDTDFRQRSFLLGSPPKVISIQLGNCSVAEVGDLLRQRFISVRRFHEDAESALLVLP